MLAPKARNSEALRQHRAWKAACERMKPRPRLVVDNTPAPTPAPELPEEPNKPFVWNMSSGPHRIIIEVSPAMIWLPSAKRQVREIAQEVAAEYGISLLDLYSQRRTRNVCLPRQIIMWRARYETSRSLPEIGRALGGRDHTTVLHAVRKIDALIASGELTLPEGWGRAA